MHTKLALASIAVLVASAPASAVEVIRTGVTDFDIATVFRVSSFLGGQGDSVIVPGGEGRFQVNGDRNDPSGNPFTSENVFGLYAVFDIPTADLASVDIASLNSLSVELNPSTNQSTGEGGVDGAGDLSIWFTTTDTAIGDLDFISEPGPPYTTPTGFGNQFADLTLLSSAFEAEGVRTITRDIVPNATAEAFFVDAINAGESIRLLIASQDAGAAFQFGTGNPPSGTFIQFGGDAPEVTFDFTVVPEPASVGTLLLATAGLLARRRR
jgi:hypothetical protein